MRYEFKRVTAFILTLALLLGMVVVPSFADDGDGKNVTNLLNRKDIDGNDNIIVTATQDGKNLDELDYLDFDKAIELKLTFRVPVLGDAEQEQVYNPLGVEENNPETYVENNDFARIILATGFKISQEETKDLMFKGKKVGVVTLESEEGATPAAIANIKFNDGDGNVFNGLGGYYHVECEFNATLEYAGEEQGIADKEYLVYILDKEYTLKVPALETDITGKKKGEIVGDEILWSFKVEAKKGDTYVTVSGLQFSDDLSNVGEYVVDSIRIGDSDDYEDASEITDETYDDDLLTCSLPEDNNWPKYVFFKTKISENDIYSNKDVNITNTAKIHENGVEKFSDSATVEFKYEWIKKEGATVYTDGVNEGEIIWTITANQYGATLPNAYIIDELSDKLEWESATYKYKDGDNWVTHGSIEFNGRPIDDKYMLTATGGAINKPVMLTIVAKVNTGVYNIGHTVQNITNSAIIGWDGGKDGGISSGTKNVNIGYNPITKKAGNYDAATHTIPWTVSVDKSDINIDLYVLDLLVYSSANFKWDEIDSIEVKYGEEKSTTIGAISLGTVKERKPQPRYNQRFEEGSFNGDDLNYVVYTLKNNGNAVADLLLVTNTAGAGIDVSSGKKEFSFKTIVTNPDIYAKNGNTSIYNTAVLYSNNEKLNEATDNATVRSKMLFKDMLNRDDDFTGEGTSDRTLGYNYDDHTVIFRLHVNANGLNNFTNDYTGVDSVSVGAITLNDTLPEGWEFVDIEENKNFLIYEGIPTSSNEITISGSAISLDETIMQSDFTTTGAVTFTFSKLEKPYVILLKAQAKEETAKEYFSKNGSTEITNEAKLTWQGQKSNVEGSQVVKIKSEILSKELLQLGESSEGELTWIVEYKPNEFEHLGKQENGETGDVYIEDTLPIGLDLRIDSNGDLDFTHITLKKLELQNDGAYTDSGTIDLSSEDKIIIYDNEKRILTFNIPDTDQAYRLNYITDVTGNIGDNLSNEVVLYSEIGDVISGTKGYTVQDSDASATMRRGGNLTILKESNVEGPLSGVEFTLYAKNSDTVIRKGLTDDTGNLAFRAIPEGIYRLKETKTIDEEEYPLDNKERFVEIEKAADGTMVTTVDGVPIDPDEGVNIITIINYKTGTVGDLTISKTVSGNAGDRSKLFEFTLELVGAADIPYDYIGYGVPNGSIRSGEKISLAHGQSITVKNLPAGATYTVTEEDYSDEGYRTTSTDETGEIIADEVARATFVNSKSRSTPSPKTGNLTISKTVTGKEGDRDKDFTFTIELGEGGFYHFTGVGRPGGTIKSGDTFTLAHGQSITITDLPDGSSYKVTESDYSDEGYTVQVNNGKGTIKVDTIVSVKFTNDYVDPEEPEDPEDPQDPEDPNKPGKPGKPGEKPDDGSGILGEGDENKPGGSSSNLPKTGDPVLLYLWILTMAGALLGIYLLFSRKLERIKTK